MTLQANAVVRLGGFELRTELEAARDELVVVVGPNGSGKSTLLRAIAGLQPIADGRIALDGRVLDDGRGTFVAPERRGVGIVLQRGYLFPHLSAIDNVAFGLPRRRRGEARAWLERLDVADLATLRPSQLSGGQARRVALARALAPRPRAILLDEPFAGLDATTRGRVRSELRRHLGGHDGVRLLVTHEPVDALALADRLVVLEGGRVVQTGTPSDLRARPRTRYVADLVGVNLFPGRASADGIDLEGGGRLVVADRHPPGTPLLAVVHPRAVALHPTAPEGSPRNVWRLSVAEVDDEGDRLRVRLAGDVALVAEVTPAGGSGLVPGRTVYASVKATEVDVHPA